VLEIVLALLAALLFALGTVLQQRAGATAPSHGPESRLLLRMARRPLWMLGLAIDLLGFVAQAAALGEGRLAVVQPLLISSVVFALPLGALLTGQRVGRKEVAAAAVVVLGLVALLELARPAGGRSQAPVAQWLVAFGACAVVGTPLVLARNRGSASRRAVVVAAAAGILFALSAALTKTAVGELHDGLVHVVASWPPYALAVVGYLSMTLNQIALDTGRLAAAITVSTAVDPVTSIVLGLTLFHESLSTSGPALIGALLALAAALGGTAALARAGTGPAGHPGGLNPPCGLNAPGDPNPPPS
jgi:drug/metabolite transporter (DMT)-like permease